MVNAIANTIETPIYTVAKCLKELIINKNLDEALEKIVEWLCTSLEIDRCYIFEHCSGTHAQTLFKSFRQGREEGIRGDSIKDIGHLFNTNSFPELKNVLDRKKTLKVSINNNVSTQLKSLLDRTELKSLILIPVYSETSTWGFIGFGDTQNIRTWRNTEQELQSLASAIGIALESKKITDDISQTNQVYNRALSNLNEVVWELNLLTNTMKSVGSSKLIGPERMGETRIDFSNWISEFVHPEDKDRVLNKFNAFLLGGDGLHQEDVYRVFNTQTNNYGWILAHRKLKKNEAGVAISVSGSARDLTSPDEVTDELEKHRDQYNFLVQSVGQVIFTLDNECAWLSISNAWKQLSGFRNENTLGTSFFNYFNEKTLCQSIKKLLKADKDTLDKQVQFVRKDGEKIWVRLLIKNTKDHTGNVTGLFGTIENIHNKYTTDLLVKESNEKLNSILNSSKEIILTINLDNHIIENVNAAVSLLGYKPEEWIGQDYKKWKTDQRKKFHELMKLAVKSQLQVTNQHISFSNKENTEEIPFEFSTSIFSFKNEKYLLCILRDIRERIEYEKSINNISTQLTHLISNIEDVYAIYDLKHMRYDFISDNIESFSGIKKENFMANDLLWKEIIHIEDVMGVERAMQEVINHKTRGEFFYRINTPSGETKMLLEKVSISKDVNGQPEKIFIVKTDYTNIENAEKSLIETERKFRFISENISDFISIHDTDGNFTYASPSIKNILGYEPEQVLGSGPLEFVHPDDVSRTLEELMMPIVIEKKETQLRYRMLSKGGEYKWIETYSKPVIDFKGEISSIISSSRDVTDQVNAEDMLKNNVIEREKLLIELEQSLVKERELNELRSMFVSTASHQFRTPLTVIQSGVEIMEMYLDDLPAEKQQRFQRQFNKIQGEVERLQYLMSDILVLGRANAARTPFQPEKGDLVEFCTQIIEEKYNTTYTADRKIILSVTGEPKPVDFDPKLIGHAFENIISNAYKYSEEGNLGFRISFDDAEVQIAISDPGIGIPDEDLKNLFQPFYRATNTNDIEGTGLGLAIMKEFVDKHSGKIYVTSVLNKGTTVNVILPIKQKN
jgi:PAS domain S-box-containing protein